MKPKNALINPKKIPYYVLLAFLTLGASLILGFLSFGGMYALFPLLPLAFAAFALSVAYEGEIYLQNIKGALKKLFKAQYLQNYLAREYLLVAFPEDTHAPDCPQFFRDYEVQLKLLGAFGHKQLNAESALRKKQVQQTLSDMEKWFAKRLFSVEDETSEQSDYAKELSAWLATHGQEEWKTRLKSRANTFAGLKAFSIVAGIFMTVGTTYLIVEAFSVIPFFMTIPFATWPLFIIPMAVIAGTAYGMLTYNAATDFVNNDTVNKWYNRFREDWSQGFSWRALGMSIIAVFLVTITVALTICTAGTWWTVASNARPLFEWMKSIPGFVMGIINPIIIGLSAVCFNFQNTAESLEMVDQASRSEKNPFYTLMEYIKDGFAHLRRTENWVQMFNPFRLILKLTITPLRILFFMGHLISIGVTADRMPGVPQIIAALIAIISEGFEDAHYFIGHGDHCADGGDDEEDSDEYDELLEHGHSHHHCHAHNHNHNHEHDHNHDHNEHQHEHSHGHDHSEHEHHVHSTKALLQERLDATHTHNHDLDIPTLILRTIALPLYLLAAAWDCLSSRMNHDDEERKVLSFSRAWNKQRGIKKGKEVVLEDDAERPSKEWQVEHTLSLIEKYKEKHLEAALCNKELVSEKVTHLNDLKDKVRTGSSLQKTLTEAENDPVYNEHRLFKQKDVKTQTQLFIEELSERVNIIPAG